MELIARKEDEGQRLDKFISSSDPSLTRSAAVLLIENGAVTVGGKAAGKTIAIKNSTAIVRITAKIIYTIKIIPRKIFGRGKN